MAHDSFSVSEVIPATPERIYSAWLDPESHSAFTGEEATFEPFVGGRHSSFGGYSEGTNLELLPGRRIVQTWRAKDFPEGSPDSRLEVTLEETLGGTVVTILHSELPSGQSERYREGWVKYYLEALKQFFAADDDEEDDEDEETVAASSDRDSDEDVDADDEDSEDTVPGHVAAHHEPEMTEEPEPVAAAPKHVRARPAAKAGAKVAARRPPKRAAKVAARRGGKPAAKGATKKAAKGASAARRAAAPKKTRPAMKARKPMKAAMKAMKATPSRGGKGKAKPKAAAKAKAAPKKKAGKSRGRK